LAAPSAAFKMSVYRTQKTLGPKESGPSDINS
jgi:hypothetical protein